MRKQNRRSFSAFSSRSSSEPKQREVQRNGNAPVPEKSAPAAVAAAAAVEAVVESPSRMTVLSQTIARETGKLEAYFKAEGLPLPSFDAQAPSDLPKLPEDIEKSRRELILATKELGNLAVGPRESVRWGTWGVGCSLPPLFNEAAQISNMSGFPSILMFWPYKF